MNDVSASELVIRARRGTGEAFRALVRRYLRSALAWPGNSHPAGTMRRISSRREGRFALADGGTILLDEVGELSPDLQAKFLRVLQEGEFEPVGSSRSRRVDLRVLAATNRDLARAVGAGEFREDLYYRLNVFPIRIPPLRERGDDVVRLAEAFIERFSSRLGRRIEPLSEENARRLKAYGWPGSVRELRNVIERAVP